MTFNSYGGSDIAPQTVGWNGKVPEPAPPERTGYTFKGWFVSAEFLQVYDFNTPVTADFTLYADWELIILTVTFYVDGEVYAAIEVPYGATFETIHIPVGLTNVVLAASDPITGNTTATAETDTLGDIYMHFKIYWPYYIGGPSALLLITAIGLIIARKKD